MRKILTILLVSSLIFCALLYNIKRFNIIDAKLRALEQNVTEDRDYLDELVIYAWKSYTDINAYSFKYPATGTLCDRSRKSIVNSRFIDVRVFAQNNNQAISCDQLAKAEAMGSPVSWIFNLKIIPNPEAQKFRSVDEVLASENLLHAQQVHTLNFTKKYPHLAESKENITEWYSSEKDEYVIIIFYKPEVGNPITIIKSDNYNFMPSNKAVADLVIKSLQFP